MNFFSLLEATRVKTQIMKRGEILYHGTSSADDFDIPDGPAWFSRSERVAEKFIGYRRINWGKNRPRMLKYKVVQQIPKLLTILSKDDFYTALGDWEIQDGYELANALCENGYNGWLENIVFWVA